MSTEQDQVSEEDIGAAEDEQQNPEQKEPAGDAERDESEQDLAVELAKAQVTIKDYWDQIMRLNAEIENNRKRAQREIENAHKFAIKGFVESLLTVTDSMEMGLNASEAENVDLDTIRQGMNMTLELFIQTLEKNGIQPIDPMGEKFNPEHHQAMTMQEDDKAEPNTVLTVMQKGYLLNDRLVRPAMVVVAREKTS